MTVPDAAAGRFGTCRKCDTRLRVPVPDAESEIAFNDEPIQPRSRTGSTTTPVKAAAPRARTMKEQYRDVPFYRRNGLVSFLVLLGFFTGLPLIPVCIIAATGDVYNPSLGDDGKLQKWGPANRYIAILLLFAWAAVVVYGTVHSK